MPAILGPTTAFPDPNLADEDGFVAVGGDLSAERLLEAYRHGIFPWSAAPLTWWSPDPRAIFELGGFHVSRSLARVVRHGAFTVTRNQAFEAVINNCAGPAPGRRETWITLPFIKAYTRLHRLGHAHSVECWLDGELAGGIYGVAIGGLFAGESMFHRADNASKVALYHLVQHLRERRFALFDIQTVTPATRSLGAVEISRAGYLRRLADAVTHECSF
jgi:leucyl/phenylalanyl-tRNA--protein transferase